MRKHKFSRLEKLSIKFTNWVGTPQSIIVHSLFFIGIFLLRFFGFKIEDILLILTTTVSLEAIYLAIFIQMTVNRTTTRLESVEDNLEDIQENVEGLEDNVAEISEDIGQIQVEASDDDEDTEKSLDGIELQLKTVIKHLDHLKTQVHNNSKQ